MTILENDLLNINTEKIRSEIPSLKDIVFFNSGWTGPTPLSVLNAIQDSFQNQIKLASSSREAVKVQIKEVSEARNKISNYFSARTENICLTTCTTLGINIALNAYNWSSDDEIVTTRTDHASVIIPLYNLKERFNVKVKLIDLDRNDPFISFKKNISKNTKAAVFCHVFWSDGLALPLKEIISELRNKNIISIIDGAQSGGALQVNLNELNPDYYCVPGHKWLLGPVGTGFLYVNKDLLGKRPPWPSVLGYESAGALDDDGQYDFNYKWKAKKDAGVFEFGGMNNSLFAGLSSAIDFASRSMKQFDVYKRIYSMSEYFIERLKENPKINVITGKNHAGLVSWQHKDILSLDIVSRLWKESKILIREVPNFNFCRASIHYFNTVKEIDYLVECLNKL